MIQTAGAGQILRMRAQLAGVLVIFSILVSAWGGDYAVAVLDEPSMPIIGKATPVETFERNLADMGVSVSRLDAGRLANPQEFNADRFDVLIVPTGASFPVAAKDALLGFLQKGGDLLCSGGYAFDRLWARKDGQWISCEDLWAQERAKARDAQASLTANGGFENGGEGWIQQDAVRCSIVEDDAYSGRACGRVANSTPDGGACWAKILPVKPGDSCLVTAMAKTDSIQGAGYVFLAVYQHDAQGEIVRFIDFVQIHQTVAWKRYETVVDIAPGASQVFFKAGLYRATGTVWLDDVTCARLPAEARMNAHFGIPGDSLALEPLQLTLFNPDQRFEGECIAPFAESLLSGHWQAPGHVEGYEATAQLRQCARWAPLIEARDAWGRSSGVAGAFVHHYSGPFARSSWAIFGATNRDVFEGDAGRQLLRDVVSRMQTGVFFQSLQPGFALYRRGETAHVKIEVYSGARTPRSVTVEMALLGNGKDVSGTALYVEKRSVSISPEAAQTLEYSWQISDDAPDFVCLQGTLSCGDLIQDRIESGFCVQDDRVVAKGTRIRYKDNAYLLEPPDGAVRKVCLFGTDTYANMFGSAVQSPWTWFRDAQMMRDCGLHTFENLQMTPPQYQFSEEQERQVDALIQISQRFGLPYMAGLLVGHDVVVSDAELQQQADLCRRFAARHKPVPGLIYYLNGDFQLHLQDLPDIRRLWNEFLRQHYGTDEKLRSAWKAKLPEAPLGQLPVKDIGADAWYSVEARDVAAFKSELVRRWVHAVCEAVRQEDAEHPITSEYYQRPYGGIDLRLTVDDMDAGNFGYFDLPKFDTAKLMACIKWNDMRFAGQTINIGEFGVKTHDAWSADRGGSAYHIQRTVDEQLELFWWVAHAAWALGVTKIQNWCWSDDRDGVFPWGIAWSNPLRAKPVLKLYNNLSLLGDSIEAEYHPAEVVFVMPDTWRLGAPESLSHTVLMNALECLLAANVPFDVANESQLARLPDKPPRLVLMPCAYALSDEMIGHLGRLAESGSCVYLSGDPSIDPAGVRQAARLESLLGAHFESECVNAVGLPFPVVTPTDAKPVENSSRIAVYQRARGKGMFVWSPEPWESFPNKDLFVADSALTGSPSSNFYLTLPSIAHVAPALQVRAEGGVWRATLTSSGANRLVTVFPRSEISERAAVRVTGAGIDIECGFRTAIPAALLLDPQGNLLAASGSQDLSVSGTRCIESDGAWMAMSLDRAPLSASRRLAVCSMAKGKLRWLSQTDSLAASVVDRRNGGLSPIAQAPLNRAGGYWEIETAPNELYFVKASSEVVR